MDKEEKNLNKFEESLSSPTLVFSLLRKEQLVTEILTDNCSPHILYLVGHTH